jgi:hypothetical protein
MKRRVTKHRKLTHPVALGDVDEVLGMEAVLPELSEPMVDSFVRRIVLAKVRDCLDALTGASDVAPTRSEEDDLIQWVSDDTTEPWSLRWCLDVLGLDVEQYRASIRKLRAEWKAATAGELALRDGAQEDAAWAERWRVGGAVEVVARG